MFDTLTPLKKIMHDFPAPWGVAGGWAIDLFMQRETRSHGDIDIAILRRDQHLLKEHLTNWFFEYTIGSRRARWDGRELDRSIHELHVRSLEEDEPDLELLLNELDPQGYQWLFRRNPTIRRTIQNTFLSNEIGIPFMAPEIVLLYRAKHHRDVNDHDLVQALPDMAQDQISWLTEALGSTHPGHPWIAHLRTSDRGEETPKC